VFFAGLALQKTTASVAGKLNYNKKKVGTLTVLTLKPCSNFENLNPDNKIQL